jgi:aminomethyltransferase
MLNDDAGVLDDLIAYRFGPSAFRLVVNAGTADKDLQWMHRQSAARGDDVTIQPRRDLAMLAVQGPLARDRFWAAWPATRPATEPLKPFNAAQVTADGVDLVVARTGYTGEDGFEVMLPADRCVDLWRRLLTVQVMPCGLGARDTLRLEAGMNLYGQDMDESVTPMEAGLGWTVELDPGHDFVGRQALERRSQRFQLLGLLLLDKGVLRAHQPVRAAGGEGLITSGSFSPTLLRSIALARLPLTAQPGDRVEVQIRDKWLGALAVKYPFVRKGKPLIALDHPTPPEKMQ